MTKNEFPNRELTFTPFIALTMREIHRFVKVIIQTVYMPVINSTLYLLIFGVSLGQHIKLESGMSYLAFLIPGLVMMGALNNALMNSSSSIVIAKFSGELEDIRVAPLSVQNIVWAMAVGGLVRGFVVGLVTYIVGSVFLYFQAGQIIVPAHVMVLIFFLTVGNLTFGKFGIAIAMWAKNFDNITAATALIITPLIYLGGVFYSMKSLSPFWQRVSYLNPLVYMINGVRYGILDISDVSILTSSVVIIAALLVSHILAVISLKYGSYNRW